MLLEYLVSLALGSAVLFSWVPHGNRSRRGVLFFALILLLIGNFIQFSGVLCFMFIFLGLGYIKRGLYYSKPVIFGVFALAFLAYMHKIPGFNNWIAIPGMSFSSESLPFRSYFSVDKVFIGAMLVATIPLMPNRRDILPMLKEMFIPGLCCLVVLGGVATLLGYITFDPKWPSIMMYWTVNNLIFVVIVEEALYRGFLQRHLSMLWPDYSRLSWLAILIPAVLFGASNYTGGPYCILLATIAGCFYGYVYRRTKRFEASVILHFLVNVVHILFFSYPASKAILG